MASTQTHTTLQKALSVWMKSPWCGQGRGLHEYKTSSLLFLEADEALLKITRLFLLVNLFIPEPRHSWASGFFS